MVGGYLPKMVVEPVYIQKSSSSLFYLSFQGAVSVESMSAGFSEMSGHGKPLKPGNLTESLTRATVWVGGSRERASRNNLFPTVRPEE